MDQDRHKGGCACGAVRFETRGEPDRVGLCHCMTCRKAHSAAFNPFVIYPLGQVEIEGELRSWQSSDHYERVFCATCGSRIYGRELDGDELELSLGSFDEPGVFTPMYESWVVRREPWLQPLAAPQHERDRPGDWRQSTV
jgi:hypothetical protein